MLLLAALDSTALGQATWITPGGGQWNVGGNWSTGTVPNGVGQSALLGTNLGTNATTITNTANFTVGSLIFSNTNSIVIRSNNITFDSTNGPALIDVRRNGGIAGHSILVSSIILNTNLVISNSTATTTLFTTQANITGSGSVTKEGIGTWQIQGGASYTGGLNINDGTVFQNAAALGLPTNGLITIGDGIGASNTAILNAQVSNNPVAVVMNSDGRLNVRNVGIRIRSISGTGQIDLETNNGFRSLIFATPSNSTYAGLITGGSGQTNTPDPATNNAVVKTGSATLTLEGANTYASRTFISQGAIRAASSSALGAAGTNNATFIYATGALELTNSLTIAEPLFLNGQGNGAGALRSVQGSNTVTGPVAIGWTGTNTGVGAITASNASLGAAAGSTLVMDTPITSTNAAIGLTKYGAGTVIFRSNNTYTGDTVVGQGTLLLAGSGRIADGSHVVISNAATMDFNDIDDTVRGVSGAGSILLGSATLTLSNTAADTHSGAISGSGGIVKTGSGTQILSGASTYTGSTLVQTGVLRVGSATGLGTVAGGTTVQAGAALELQGGVSIGAEGLVLNGSGIGGSGALRSVQGFNEFAGAITNLSAARINSDLNRLTLSGGIDANNQLLTFGGAGETRVTGVISNSSAGLAKDGSGVLTLQGVNTYTGTTTITGGTLALGINNAISTGPVTVTGGTLNIATFSDTVGAVSLISGNITGTTGTLTATSYDVQSGNISARLGGSGVSLTKSGPGTVTMSGSSTYSGATVVSNGVLVLSNSAGNAINNSSGITVEAGAALILGASNQIGDGIGLVLNGGTFVVGNATAGYSETLGTLTLSASSTIDLGSASGLRTLTFANSSGITWSTNAVLTISNWQGVALNSGDAGRILFGVGGLTSTQLAQVYWAQQDISGGALIEGELVPIPEARIVWAAIAISLFIAWRERRRIAALLQRSGGDLAGPTKPTEG